VKQGLVQRFENHPHGLLHHPVYHVGDTEAALASAALGDEHASDLSGPVRPLEQRRAHVAHDVVEMLAHHGDGLAVGARGSLVTRHLVERRYQAFDDVFHHRQMFHHHVHGPSLRDARLRPGGGLARG